MQTRDGLVDRAVILTPPFEVNRCRIDGEVVKHRAQCLMWPITEHLAPDHEYLAAVEVIEKRRELEPVSARPEVTVVEQGHLRAASLPAGGHLVHIHRLHAGDGVAAGISAAGYIFLRGRSGTREIFCCAPPPSTPARSELAG